MYILLALLFVALAGGLSFVFGRIIDITTLSTFDYSKYHEVPIWGDVEDQVVEGLTFEVWNVCIDRSFCLMNAD